MIGGEITVDEADFKDAFPEARGFVRAETAGLIRHVHPAGGWGTQEGYEITKRGRYALDGREYVSWWQRLFGRRRTA